MDRARILVVEDEALIALDIKERLEDLGYEVVGTVASGEDALELAKTSIPDLVLMDIVLKGAMDGIDAAQQFMELFQLPIIYVTAHADTATLERAMVTEPYGYVLKPIKELELKTAIELALYKHKKQKGRQISVPEPALVDTKSSAENQEIVRFLSKTSVFSDAPSTVLNRLAEGGRRLKFQAGELIAFEGDPDVGGFLVISGRIALVKTSLQGKELVVELLPPGDIFGLIAALDQKPYPVTVKAQVESEVLRIRRSVLFEILDEHPEFNQRIMQEVFDRLRGAHDLSRLLAHEKVEVRIASALLALLPKFAVTNNDSSKNTVFMTRQEIAELIGSTSETVIRITKDMERDGILDLKQSAVIKVLNSDALTDLATGF